jgi:prevent-host-death family protein
MSEISVRELRNHGGRVLQRVARGEHLTITLDGKPVAELRPLPDRSVSTKMLLRRWRSLPRVHAGSMRADIDREMDPTL